MSVTGHLLNSDGTVGSQEKIGQYSNGLGVTNDNEYITILGHTKYTDAHFVDGWGSMRS